IRVDVIARKLKITRGSFYYHFEGRAEFLSAILKEWHQSTTTLIHEYLAKSSLTPAEQFNYLLDLTTSGDQRAAGGRVEQAVSQWATYSVDAA
ncbi:UNVERIFIED_CONTAM: TetR/AcrR family transcriptional regulator, partial [Bacteroidetes bacterium 56_B9]